MHRVFLPLRYRHASAGCPRFGVFRAWQRNGCPRINIKVYDNGGATIDRYTVVYLDSPTNDGCYECLAMSDNPNRIPFTY